MNKVLAQARGEKTMFLRRRVNSQNDAAIGFYQHYGFKATSEDTFRAGEGYYRVVLMETRAVVIKRT